MKYLFASVFCVLIVASVFVRLSFPDLQTDRPVIYWVTDKNPAREQQVATFHQWLIKNGHVDENGEPVVELRLDVANMDQTKQTTQSVSGVAGDTMDTYDWTMRLYQAMGVLEDVTDDALEMGFDPSQTYPAIVPALTVDGRQYRYPANVANSMMWVNVDTFRRFGFEPPDSRWTWEEFEALGLAFKEAANPPGTTSSDRRFIASDIPVPKLMRTAGLSELNETLTASNLDDPLYVKTLETKKRWVYDLNILPTPDDEDAVSSQQGFGGPRLQLFSRGQYAMVEGGRWLLIPFRRFDNLGELKVVEFPHAGFPCTTIQTRAVVLYAGSKHPELAKLFLAYLASEDYNKLIVADADALPPNPKYATGDAFFRPPDFPNEWQAHRAFVEAATTIAIGNVYSPYVLPSVLKREREYYEDSFMSGVMNAEEAAERTAASVNAEIAAELVRKPHLADAYAKDVALQEKIDALKADGQPIPAAWVKNTYYRAYYDRNGLLLHDEPQPEPSAAAESAEVSS